jgi:hypothetical protein
MTQVFVGWCDRKTPIERVVEQGAGSAVVCDWALR